MVHVFDDSATDRYLLGYGGKWPDIRWPNGASLAVSFMVNYEEGAQNSLGWGDDRNERSGDLVSGMPDGVRDIAIEQMFAYGTRAGIWRVNDIFREHGRLATYCICGRAAERTPEIINGAIEQGHEAACHGYRWSNFAEINDRSEEKREIVKAVNSIFKVTGKRPVGFYGRWGPSQFTRSVLSELGFLYDSNAYDDDIPYWDNGFEKPILVIPYSLDTNDFRFVEADPWGTSGAWLSYLQASLNILRAEAKTGKPRILNIGLHPRIIGRPGRFDGLARFLAMLDALEDEVWVARRVDIANHWISAAPVIGHGRS